jgi:hypothetical protein
MGWATSRRWIRSADLQSAVSQVFNLLRLRPIGTRSESANALPIANRRSSRLQVCATSLGRNGFGHRAGKSGRVQLNGYASRLSRFQTSAPFTRRGAAAGRLDLGDLKDLVAGVAYLKIMPNGLLLLNDAEIMNGIRNLESRPEDLCWRLSWIRSGGFGRGLVLQVDGQYTRDNEVG